VSLSTSVIGNTALLTFASGFVRLFSIATAPILTSLLGPVPYGVVALAGTASALLTTLAIMGIETGYARAFLSDVTSDRRGAERFCWRFVATTTMLSTVAILVAWWTGVCARFGWTQDIPLMVATSVVTMNASTMVVSRARLRGDYQRIAVAAIANGVLGAGTMVVLAFVWRRDGWPLVIGAATGLIAGIAVLRGIPLGPLVRASELSRQERWRIVQLGLPMALTAPMYWVLGSSDRWIIGLLQDEHVLGVYSFAYGVGNFASLINAAVIQTWLPETSRAFDADPEAAPRTIGVLWARMYALMAVAWLVVAAAGGDVIRLLAAPQFHAGAAYIPWIAGGIFFYGLYHTANTGLLLRNDLRPAAAWWLCGALLSVSLNFVLVSRIGALGAAITAPIGFGFISGGVMWSSQRRLRLEIPWRPLGAATVLILATGLACARPWHASALASLAMKVPVGAAAAAVALRWVAPTWFRATLRLALRRG